jgi:hypothetical protein
VVVPPPLNAADFSSITRSDGKEQTTFKGWPLYYYAKDRKPGDSLGEGENGMWFVVNPFSFPPTPGLTPSASPTLTPAPTPVAGPGELGPRAISFEANW